SLTRIKCLSFVHYFIFILLRPPSSTLFPYTTLFRSIRFLGVRPRDRNHAALVDSGSWRFFSTQSLDQTRQGIPRLRQSLLHVPRSEEHTSELQSRFDLVCRLLLEKKKKIIDIYKIRT